MKSETKQKIKDFEFKIILLDLIKWKLIDLYRFKKHGKKLHMYGVRCLTGMYGCGKTMVMTKIACDLRRKHGNDIYICTNFGLSLQDFEFNDVKQTGIQYDKPVVFMWDEVQNEFPATDKVFPKEIRQALSLNRKGNGKMFYWGSQDHELVHKTIRRLTIEYGVCRTIFGRYTKVRWYRDYDYRALYEEVDINKKMKIHPFKKMKFIQNDYIRSLYDSYGWDNGEKLKT